MENKLKNAILDTTQNIDKNIDILIDIDKALLNQNILSTLRNLVEYVIQLVYNENSDPNNYEDKKRAINYAKSIQNSNSFLIDFHKYLQVSVSHYTQDENGAERLILKYEIYLFKIRNLLQKDYGIKCLMNIDKMFKNPNKRNQYYDKIISKIENQNSDKNTRKDVYYIEKITPFFNDTDIYYQIIFTDINDHNDKSNRYIAFTKIELMDNYAVQLKLVKENIKFLNENMDINIIVDWEVAIRPCEMDKIGKIVGVKITTNRNNKWYKNTMQYLKQNSISLAQIIKQDNYRDILQNNVNIDDKKVLEIFNKCHEIICAKKNGANVILYLLHKMKNSIINKQINNTENQFLSNLFLKNGCIPFDKMPYATALIQHTPNLYNLILSIEDSENRKHEFIARKFKQKTEKENIIFNTTTDGEISKEIKKYNENVYWKHQKRKIDIIYSHYYIKEYPKLWKELLEELKKFSKNTENYNEEKIKKWLKCSNLKIDCEEKKIYIEKLFANSNLAIITGSAGTGKTKIVEYVSDFFINEDKIYISITNSSVYNMENRIEAPNSEFKTVNKFIKKKINKLQYHLLVVDEASMISNSDMLKILKIADELKIEYLILVGDKFQIEAIKFGNWFRSINEFIKNDSIIELKTTFRSSDEKLLALWDKVRRLDENLEEYLVKEKYSKEIDETIFNRAEDQIVLCLNYDGITGINNINKILQNTNKSKKLEIGLNIYKINDPIVFSENNNYSQILFNNLKGKIRDFQEIEKYFIFEVEVYKKINSDEIKNFNGLELLKNEEDKAIIKIKIAKQQSTDEDTDINSQVPFKVAYALSIHKSQGLEYDKVKIIIDSSNSQEITHSVFYTAITRAKKELTIYWDAKTERAIFKKIKETFNEKKENDSKNINIFKKMYNGSI